MGDTNILVAYFTSAIYKHYWKLEISGFHSGKYKDDSHLGYSAT
jgi:hypothetical protein